MTLDFIEKAAAYIEAKYAAKGGDAAAFGGAKYASLDAGRTARPSSRPSCRGCAARSRRAQRLIGTVQDDATILRFVNSKDAPRLAELGTSCPDHFLRTKIKPLYVDWNPQAGDAAALKAAARRRPRALPQGLRGLLRQVQAPQLAGDARPEPDGRPHPRPRA